MKLVGRAAVGTCLRRLAVFCRCLRAKAFRRAIRARSAAARLTDEVPAPVVSLRASLFRSVRARGALLARVF